jgi:hypothetical protein
MEKRGEVTSSQIIILVVAILGFVIVISFLFVFINFDTYGDDQTCSLSVITRATAPSEAQRLLPLKCATKKICIRSSKDDKCNQFIGEKNVQYVDLPSEPELAAREIEKTQADALYNCWKLMGEGKLDLFGGGKGSPVKNFLADTFSVPEINPKCVICSRVAISEGLKTKGGDTLKRVNVNRYMANERPDNSQLTYLQTFTDEQVRNYPINFTDDLAKTPGKKTDEIATIFMQVLVADDAVDEAFRAGTNTGVVLGTGLALGPTGTILKIVGFKFTIATYLASVALSSGLAYSQTIDNQGLAATSCGEFASSSKGRYGCSIFTPIDYSDIDKINQLCVGGIEGNP